MEVLDQINVKFLCKNVEVVSCPIYFSLKSPENRFVLIQNSIGVCKCFGNRAFSLNPGARAPSDACAHVHSPYWI